MQDAFGRRIDYLRVSVTDRCNLRCIYCMPKEGISWIPSQEILRYEEIAAIVRCMAELGVNKVRLTGGEPLLRADLPDLVRMLRTIPQLTDIALSTNGLLLAKYARVLAQAGVNRVNVSLDSLSAEKFAEISHRPGVEKVFQGMELAQTCGLSPLKINVVVIRGKNDDELAQFAELTRKYPWQVRFIELMPLAKDALGPEAFVSSDEVIARLKELGPLEPVSSLPGSGPARYFRLPGAQGAIGVISPLSHSFCSSCNRVRLTAVGRLVLCLFSGAGVDLREPLRQGAGPEQLKRIITEAMAIKPEKHALQEKDACPGSVTAMSQIGG